MCRFYNFYAVYLSLWWGCTSFPNFAGYRIHTDTGYAVYCIVLF